MFNKKIVSNTLAQLVAKGVAVLLTLVSTTYIIRVGGTGLFGDYTKALALIAIGFTAIDFGLNAEAVRSMRGPLSHDRRILASTLLARLLLSFAAVLALNLAVQFLPGGYAGPVRQYFWLGSLAIIFQGFYTSANAWFQRRLQYWHSSLAVIISTSLGTILTLYFVARSGGLAGLLLASTLGYLVMGLLSLLFLLPHLPRSYSLSNALSHLRRSLVLGAVLILSILASKLDTVILGIFRSSAEVGEYGFAYRLFDVALVLPVFVMNSIYPLLVSADKSAKTRLISTSSRYLLLLGFLGTILLLPLAPLIHYVKPGLTLSVTSFRLLVLALPVFYLTAPLMWQLIESRRERALLVLYSLAALLNAALNLVFTPTYGALAAALFTGLTELFILLGLLYLSRKQV